MTSETIEGTPFELDIDWQQLPRDTADVADVAVDDSDNVFVFSRGDKAVRVYSSAGDEKYDWAENVFTNPHGITVASDATVYCADHYDHTVRRFSPAGDLLHTYGTKDTPSATGAVPGKYLSMTQEGPPFNGCTATCVLSTGDVYIADGYGNARVHHFSPDGDLVRSWGKFGSDPGEFRVPHSIASSPDDSVLYVADRENSRIQLFAPDGALLDVWTDVCRPNAIAIDRDGKLYVAEMGARVGLYDELPEPDDATPWSRCSVFDSTGELLWRWGTSDPDIPGSFFAAHGIAVDGTGSVYVSEVPNSVRAPNASGRRRLQKFRLAAAK